uniref:RNA-binding S4 domain-containing protein n=1 Tax=Ascaris lumbricoides TaxID=6252 RepID=A0A9J2P0B5_ASCLU
MRLLLSTSAWMQANVPKMLPMAKQGCIAPPHCASASAYPLARCYSSRRGGDSEASTADDGLPKDYKLKTLKTGSRRLDTVINRAIGKSSSQVEKLVLSGKVLVNESAVTKKAYNVQKADVIDVWNGPFEENAELAVVDRIEVMDYALTTIGYDIHVKTWKKFLVSNWKQSTQ